MSAMKRLHEEYGSIVYQADVENTIERSVLFAKQAELIQRYGSQIQGMLDDIYDDVTDFPENWECYSIGGERRQWAAIFIRYVKAMRDYANNDSTRLVKLYKQFPVLNDTDLASMVADYVAIESGNNPLILKNRQIIEHLSNIHTIIKHDQALSDDAKVCEISKINYQFGDLLARFFFDSFMDKLPVASVAA